MRSCNNCHECCNGNLSIPELDVSLGKPCKFMCNTGCSIYKYRPETCRNFTCLWLDDESIPESLYPKESGIVIYRQIINGSLIYVTQEFWNKLSEENEKHMIDWYRKKSFNGAIVKKDKIIAVNYGNKYEFHQFINKLQETSELTNDNVVIQYIS